MKKFFFISIIMALPAFAHAQEYDCRRPAPEDRLFVSEAVEAKIIEVQSLLTNPRLAWMFGNCFPNTLDTTVHFTDEDETA